MNFDDSFDKLIGHEGGYVNNPADPGGETKFGISKRSYPGEDIAGMTLERARSIYRRDYWGPAGCDAVPDAIKFDLFDMAVNAGIRSAIKSLQRACGVFEDGVLGPQTIQAVSSIPGDKLRLRFNAARLRAFTEAKAWPAFGRGWVLRVAENMES